MSSIASLTDLLRARHGWRWGWVLLALTGCDPTMVIDAGLEDAAADAPSPLDAPAEMALPMLREAFAANTDVFCACLPMRNPEVTEEACRTALAMAAELRACEDEAVASIGSAFEAYYRCRTAAVEALTTCFGRTCSDAAVMGCAGDFSAADTACNARLPRPEAITFIVAYEACLQRTITGPAMMCPDDPSATSSALGDGVFTGSTDLAGNDSEPLESCFVDDMESFVNGAGAPDRSYRWRAPSAGRFQIDTIGTEGFDTLLYVRSACDDDVDLGCSDDIDLGVDQDSCVTVDLSLDQEVVVVVDGFGPLGRGAFVVNVTAIADDAVCPTPPPVP